MDGMNDAQEQDAPVATTTSNGSRAVSPHVDAQSAPAPVIATTNDDKQDTESGAAPSTAGVTNEEENSEAETWIESPQKKRIVESAGNAEQSKCDDNDRADAQGINSDGKGRKRKRIDDEIIEDQSSNGHDSSRRSSPLSSPGPAVQADGSDSDISSPNSRKRLHVTTETAKQRKRRPSDLSSPDAKRRPATRQSIESTSNQDRRETRSATYPRQSSNERSPSPECNIRREHRRVASTQLGSSIALTKKRRVPAPLITSRRNRSTDRQSVSSDTSSSPAPNRPGQNKFASTDKDVMSPAKGPGGPRKFRDKNGRSFIARACSNDDIDAVKIRYEERPMDLNVPDNAGNTPLQIAALEGYLEVVEFLLEKRCEVNTRNFDGDTPLIDAVENGHVEVVKLLLDYGANPRAGNRSGDEPLELIQDKTGHNYQEVRKLLADAKLNENIRRRSDDHDRSTAVIRDESSRGASGASPRDSPPIGPRSPPPLTSRRRTGRSDFTRNDLLWQANTQENLTKLAGKGDVQGVASILNILQKAETESLIAAARGGHDEVLQYLLGMGNPDPDPDPVRSESLRPGYDTPLLAAIGRGNTVVIKLLVEQSGFNPTRIFKGRTYFDISAERKGVDWEEEHKILKAAFENYKGPKARKHTSPRKSRDANKDATRQITKSSSPGPPSQRRAIRSPGQNHKDLPNRRGTPTKEGQREVKRETSNISRLSDDPRKKKVRDSNSGEHSVAVFSDLDANSQQDKVPKMKRSQSDVHTAETESAQKRRRLITGKEHRRRASLAGADDVSDGEGNKKNKPGRPPLKRQRDSATPEKLSKDSDAARLSIKKRRTVLDSSPETVRSSTTTSSTREIRGDKAQSGNQVERPERKQNSKAVQPTPDSKFQISESKGIGAEEIIVETAANQAMQTTANKRGSDLALPDQMEDIGQVGEKDSRNRIDSDAEAAAAAAAKAEQEARAEAERIAAEEEAARLQAEKDAEALAARQLEEKAAHERRLLEEAAARKRAEEEALARKKEEEERLERVKREAEEHQRRQEQRRQRESLEAERRRQDALPSRLRKCAKLLDQKDPEVFSPAWLQEFLPLLVVRSSQIIPELDHLKRGIWEDIHPDDEEWMPNYQVAYLLATKDLYLRSYTSLERREVTRREREGLWRLSRIMLSFDYHAHAYNTNAKLAEEKEREERPKFMAMQEVFWVKLSDFLDQVERHPHLRGLTLKRQHIGFYPTPSESPQVSEVHKADTNGLYNGPGMLTNGVGMSNGDYGL